jgi:prolipoprotein diacylglyceryltransferase
MRMGCYKKQEIWGGEGGTIDRFRGLHISAEFFPPKHFCSAMHVKTVVTRHPSQTGTRIMGISDSYTQ